MRESIKNAETHGWYREPLGRARLHLARVLRERLAVGTSEEIKTLENGARELLADFLKLDRPEYLQGEKDEIAIFDSFQVAFNGRFTGCLLLQYIQKHHQVVTSLHTNGSRNRI